MMIKNIDTSHMKNNKFFELHAEIIRLLTEIGADVLHITAFWTAHLALFKTLDDALKKIVMSAKTEMLHEADKARDELYANFVKMVAAFCGHYDDAIRQAAKEVHVVIHTYGKVTSMSLSEETSAIYNMAQELKTDKYKDFVALLNLTEWLGKIEAANDTCRNLTQERDRENADKDHTDVRSARHALDASYHNIVDVINANLLLGHITGCDSFVNTMNEIIRRFSIKSRTHRHGTHGAETEAEEEAGTEA